MGSKPERDYIQAIREEADTAAGKWSDALEAAKTERDEARAEVVRVREALRSIELWLQATRDVLALEPPK